MDDPASRPLIAQGLACGRCGYRLDGLPDVGASVRCPECGNIGAPIKPEPKPTRAMVVRVLLIASTVLSSGMILLASAFGAWVAFQADWSLSEARAMSLTCAAIGAGALYTGCLAVFVHRQRGFALRLAGIAFQLGIIAFAVFRWRESFQMFTRIAPPPETLILAAYAAFAIATLARRTDLERWRSLLSPPAIRRSAVVIAGVVVAAILIYGSVYAIRAGPQLRSARALASLGARVSWEGPRVVGVFAKGLPLTDRDLSLLSSLPEVKSLDLSETRITDQGFSHVANLGRLTHLCVDGTAVSDSGIELLRGHGSLRSFWASDTGITDAAMPTIATLRGLQDLYLGGTSISDDGLALLRDLPHLKYINVPETRVTPLGADDLKRHTSGLEVWAGEP